MIVLLVFFFFSAFCAAQRTGQRSAQRGPPTSPLSLAVARNVTARLEQEFRDAGLR